MALGHSEIEFFGKKHFCATKTVDLATIFENLFVCFLFFWFGLLKNANAVCSV